MHFWGYYISALRGCCAMKFLHALKIDQCYLAHTPIGTGVAQKILSRTLKIWPKIQRFKVNNFRVSGSILTGLLSVDARRGRGDNLGTMFTRSAPINLWPLKMSKIRLDFWQVSTLTANISGTDQRIENLKSFCKSATPPTLNEKSWCTLVHKQKSY